LQSAWPDLFAEIGNHYLTYDDPAKVADPATLPANNGTGASWSPDGRYLAIAHQNSPYVTVYDSVPGMDTDTEFVVPDLDLGLPTYIKTENA